MPYLPRLATAAMVSYYYAKFANPEQLPTIPLLVDSGGFASLFENSQVIDRGSWGVIKMKSGEESVEIDPRKVLQLQEQLADVAFTLDFPIPPGLPLPEAHLRLDLTCKNARWAIANRRRRDLPLMAGVQGWNESSYVSCVRNYKGLGFDGFAIGGLIPRRHDTKLVLAIVEAVKQKIGDKHLHVFGLGHPTLLTDLYKAGADSVDSSSYVKYAVEGKLWSDPDFHALDPSVTDRLNLALANLALATQKTLPLATAEAIFATLRGEKSRF